MTWGLSEQTISAIHNIFAQFPEIESAILYGSRAKGNYREGSDIDITLKGAALTTAHVLRISNAIDDILLPYQFDISVWHTIENTSLLEHIERIGQVFYTRDVPR